MIWDGMPDMVVFGRFVAIMLSGAPATVGDTPALVPTLPTTRCPDPLHRQRRDAIALQRCAGTIAIDTAP